MNPLTRKHQVLPFLLLDAQDRGKNIWGAWSFGFGYDPISDDYKVVRLGQYLGLSDGYFETETLVNSLKENVCRKIHGMDHMLGIYQKMGVLVGNALHWLVGKNKISVNPDMIVGFDIGVEVFREVPTPGHILDQNGYVRVGIVGEWLSVNAIYMDERLNVWVMKDYGVKESWIKLFSVTANELPSLKCMRTLAFSKNGDELLMGLWDGTLFWYNLKEKSIKRVKIHGTLTPFVSDVFGGSLVSLSANKETDVKKARKGRKKRMKRDEFLSKGFKLVL